MAADRLKRPGMTDRITRRTALCLCSAAALSPAGAWAAVPDIQPGDRFVPVDDPSARPLAAADLVEGAPPLLVWPLDPQTGVPRNGQRQNQLLFYRPPGAPPVAFSAICTHAGCTVSRWDAAAFLMLCPCHSSEFDPARDGAVKQGPAPRPLPSLPLRVRDGILEAGSGLSS